MQRKRTWWFKQYDHDSILSRHHAPGPHACVLVLDHLKAGFNVAKILRSANVFGLREVHLVGMERFDPSPGKGALRHTRTRVFADVKDSFAALRADGYALVALGVEGREVLGHVPLPERTAFVLGHEEWGLSFRAEDHADVRSVRIAQHGVVQSLNVSVAASIAAWEWLRQHGPDAPGNTSAR
jgi:tRNA G18 (ribose-2'-O)-methylase SpoU